MGLPGSICIAGNCQIRPLANWLRSSLPSAQISVLEPYHLLANNEQIEAWLEECRTADCILEIPVTNGYRQLSLLGTDQWWSEFGARLALFPNLHSDVLSHSMVMKKIKRASQ